VFDQYFVGRLKKDVQRLHLRFPELGDVGFPERLSLRGFDDLYTAPRSGFVDAADYYRRCSAAGLVSNISLPALILCAMDDPVVDADSLAKAEFSDSCDLVLTPQGGHVGFLGSAAQRLSFRWMDDLIMRWVLKKTQGS